MAIVRWAPFDLASEGFDDLVRRTFGDFGSSLLKQTQTNFAPALNAHVEGNELRVAVELPGIDPDNDVEIEVDNGMLRISGERKTEQTSENGGWSRREMQYGSFERRIALPEGIDPQNVQATYDAGILHVTVPLPEKQQTKVKVGVTTHKQLNSDN